jgi:hypothetical protein
MQLLLHYFEHRQILEHWDLNQKIVQIDVGTTDKVPNILSGPSALFTGSTVSIFPLAGIPSTLPFGVCLYTSHFLCKFISPHALGFLLLTCFTGLTSTLRRALELRLALQPPLLSIANTACRVTPKEWPIISYESPKPRSARILASISGLYFPPRFFFRRVHFFTRSFVQCFSPQPAQL